jgi:hypothetical protein
MRDNLSFIKLETNGITSSGKRTRHFDNKYFCITDLIERKEVTIKYCLTDTMIYNHMTKPLSGSKCHKFRKLIMIIWINNNQISINTTNNIVIKNEKNICK